MYVRNLPSSVSTLDIVQEFKNFGTIKQDGVFLRNRKVSYFSCVNYVLKNRYVLIQELQLLLRMLVSAMPLLSLKMCRVFRMHSRFEIHQT